MRKDGSRFWCSGVISAVRDREGKLRGFVKVLRDNTSRKLAEENLKKAKRAAEAANEAKDQFLANMSHELRTPLSAMLLWANMLENREEIAPAQLREGLAAIKRSAEAQKQLIEDLLDTSRISAGKLRLELREIELATVLHSAVEAVRPAAGAKRIEMEAEFDPSVGIVRADPHRLQQVVWNLLSNAVKFTPAGGRVNIHMQRKGDEVEIRVADTGRGISPEFLPHVFDRFGQAEPTVIGAKGGLGLGLTISKQLVELHEGTISVESQGENRGAVFTMRLPMPQINHADAVAGLNNIVPLDVARALTGVHILLIEDEPVTRAALTTLLREAGAEVNGTGSTSTALEEFKRRRPDLIVSDIGLPDGDGYELLRTIRTSEKSGNGIPVPAVALTAYAYEKDRRKARESGFQHYLTKPIEPRRLLAILAALLSKR
jgi:signal transduction histidine kinase/ActR/RegA family two-component response regulator